MNILLIKNPVKPQSQELASSVRTFLKERGATVVETCTDSSSIDLIVSLGGDGSILKIIHEFPSLDVPVVGINLGSLGFLADIGTTDLLSALDQVLAGSYVIQNRLMIEGHKESSDSFVAVNEMVVHRGKNPTLVDLALYVDGRYLNTFSADGVIIATPSGSTAYSLSAGGPILTPDLDAVIITPICPHAISNRPIVLKMQSHIEIQYLSEHAPVEVSFDGMCRFSLQRKEKVVVKKAMRTFRLVTLKSHDYFETLRTKLGWTGTLKN